MTAFMIVLLVAAIILIKFTSIKNSLVIAAAFTAFTVAGIGQVVSTEPSDNNVASAVCEHNATTKLVAAGVVPTPEQIKELC